MKYPMLIGRKFLKNRFFDVSKEYLTKTIYKRKKWEFIYYQEIKIYIQQKISWRQKKGWEVKVIDYLKCTIEIMKNVN